MVSPGNISKIFSKYILLQPVDYREYIPICFYCTIRNIFMMQGKNNVFLAVPNVLSWIYLGLGKTVLIFRNTDILYSYVIV